jgi:hypothetical protein
MAWLTRSVGDLAGPAAGPPVLAWAGELTLRLIERGRSRTPQLAFETLKAMTAHLSDVAGRLPAAIARPALRSGVDLTLKLLEVSFISQSQVASMVESVAMAAASAVGDAASEPDGAASPPDDQ